MSSHTNDDRPLVQWTFLQLKKSKEKTSSPKGCFLHSSTQIGSKLLIYGGSDYCGEALNQLFIYDTVSFLWSSPVDETTYQEDHPGKRYGHSATLLEMHPPKIMFYGGMVTGGTYEFDAPNGMGDDLANETGVFENAFMNMRRQGKKANLIEETDDAVYFLSMNTDRWVWSKPLVPGGNKDKPHGRSEHTASKIGTNEIAIFGGCTMEGPMNDIWVFNYVDMEWKPLITSGIHPKPRFRHSAEVMNNKLYILGGSCDPKDIADGNKHLGIHELSLDTLSWSHPQIKGVNPFPRSGHASHIIGAHSIGIFGGKKNSDHYCNDFVIIDLETFSSTVVNAVEAHLPKAVSGCSLNNIGNKCYVFGGTDNKGECYNDIRFLDITYYLDKNDITVGEGASSDYCFKVLIIGDSNVGKSAILTRFSEKTFLSSYTATIGIDFNSRMIRVDRSICKLEIWDTAGQERFSTITANYYRGAQGALLVYDIASKDSFEHVKNWYDRAKQLGGEDLVCILVGNKNDLPEESRQVSSTEGQLLADELGIPFLETSALNGTNVEAGFVKMTADIKASVDRRGLNGIKSNNLKKAGNVSLASSEQKRNTCGCSRF